MSIRVLANRAGEFELFPVPATKHEPSITRGDIFWETAGSWGRLSFRQWEAETISIHQHAFRFEENEELRYSCSKPALRLQVSLQNSFHYETVATGKAVLHERGMSLYYADDVQWRWVLNKGEDYSLLTLHYPVEELDALQGDVPGLNSFLHKIKAGEPALFIKSYCVADAVIVTLTDKLLDCPYSGELRKTWLESVAKEILVLALEKMVTTPDDSVTPADKEAMRVYRARDFLRMNMDKHFSLPVLAKQTGSSTYKLNNGFRAVYGITVVEWLLEARMSAAHKLLEETDDPVSQVARSSGYAHPHAFTLAFKKYFGYTPAFVQKNGKKF
jgi:AraC family transcriptional activator of pyochelin receptor